MRAELFHPLIVHFPIALLLVGSMLRLAHYFLRKRHSGQVVLLSSWVLLLLGVLCAWLAVLAGEVAEDIVRSGLCKPGILEQHKHLAYTAAILFSLALTFDFGKIWMKKFRLSGVTLVITAGCSILYFAAAFILILTGGFGADLVYEQGAAVQRVCQ